MVLACSREVLLTPVSYRRQVNSVTMETAAAVGKGKEAEEWAETGIFQLCRQTACVIKDQTSTQFSTNIFGVTQ